MSEQDYQALTAEQWGKIYNEKIYNQILADINKGKKSFQTIEMLKLSNAQEKILEIGSGSGATSINLALENRKTTALDFSKECLNLTKKIAENLKCSVDLVYADATKELPFSDDDFDIVFQAGLLEHFEKEKRIELLKLWSRVGKKTISIIPNAASIAYRVGKAIMEKDGSWGYGKELPQYSMKQEYQLAGLKVIEEYTIGEQHALEFLPKKHYLRKALQKWINENICNDNCGQGYLLVTVGEKDERYNSI